MDAEVRRRLQEYDLGLEAKQFLDQSNLGRRIAEKAVEDERAALIALKSVDPNDAKAVQLLQNEANAPLLALQWLNEIINEGENAKAAALEAETQQNY